MNSYFLPNLISSALIFVQIQKKSKFFEILAILSFLTFDIKMKGLGECFDLG